MRVLMTVDGSGSVLAYTADLISALSREGVTVSVAAHGLGLAGAERDRLSRAGATAVHETGLRLEWVPDLVDELERARVVLGEIEQAERPDVIHANSFVCGSLEWRAPVVIVAHGCMLSRWRAVHRVPAPDRLAQLRRSRRVRDRDGGRGDRAHAGAAQRADRRVRQRRAPGSGDPGGCSLPEAPESPRDSVALAVGRMSDAAKNLATLSAAATKMRHPGADRRKARSKTGSEASARIAGTPELLGALEPDELARLRRRVAVFVAPARYEPLGLPILEAARDGCALVLGDIASLRELWDGAALFVPAGRRRPARAHARPRAGESGPRHVAGRASPATRTALPGDDDGRRVLPDVPFAAPRGPPRRGLDLHAPSSAVRPNSLANAKHSPNSLANAKHSPKSQANASHSPSRHERLGRRHDRLGVDPGRVHQLGRSRPEPGMWRDGELDDAAGAVPGSARASSTASPSPPSGQ